MAVSNRPRPVWLQLTNQGSALSLLIGLGAMLYGGVALARGGIPEWGGLSLPAGLGIVLLTLTVWFQLRPRDHLDLRATAWQLHKIAPDHWSVTTSWVARNQNPTLEVTLAQIQPRLHLLGKGSTRGIHTEVEIQSRHLDADPRPDNYWQAYILSPQSETGVEVSITLRGEGLATLQSCWLELDYIQYGRQARTPKTSHIIVPLEDVDPTAPRDWQDRNGVPVIPIRTQLLTATDDLADIIRRYVDPWGQPGDYVTLAESAVAITQGNYRHPTSVRLGWLAQRLCYCFPSKTSLSSAYGMQTLIDSSSAWQVLGAFLLGIATKGVGIPGVFYALAGEQAALIDDVTGTLPPYDQFLVLGPHNGPATVTQLQQQTGYEIAIVDVNDLKEVKIVAASAGIQPEIVRRALRDNPAGNSAEQTPVVLIRPPA